jgi:hypothetical protein
MATRRSGHQPGGGIASRVVKHSSNPKSEPKSYGRNPAAVAQFGVHVGSHTTALGGQSSKYKGEPDFTRAGYSPPQGPTSFANVGPGGGRTVYKTGTQCQTGPVNKGMPGLPSTRGQWPDAK